MTNKPSFRAILLAHAARYPAWQPQDVYKLAHQAALGSEHAVTDHEHARAWLQRELSALTPASPHLPDEPLIDPISEDDAIVRVHLRPLARLGLTPESLLEAFLRTAAEYQGSRETLKEYLLQAVWLKTEQAQHSSVREWSLFFMEMAQNNYPSLHHSEEYTRAYRPAYRVVARDFLPQEFCEP